MNILTLRSCGNITEQDDYAVMIQNVTRQQAYQFALLLALSNKDTACFQFVGMDIETGDMLPGELVVTYEQALAALGTKMESGQ